MEGDMKEIVLERLEQRLKEKDAEIRSLKMAGGGQQDLADRVDRIETEVREAQITLSEVMRKVGELEGALGSLLVGMVNAAEETYPEEDLSIPGGMPQDQPPFDKFAADGLADPKADQKDNKDAGHNDSDATRFFHLSRNS